MIFFFEGYGDHRDLHSFPTRRSSDLWQMDEAAERLIGAGQIKPVIIVGIYNTPDRTPEFTDRKSTRLNSSHSQISYAVFCLKKKKNTKLKHRTTAKTEQYEERHRPPS